MVTAIQQKKSYQWLYQFSAYSSIFAVLTLFGPLFALFCDSMRMSKTRIGFILSLLPLVWPLSIFVSKWIMRLGPKKTLIRFYFIRYCVLLGLPLAALVAGRFGDNIAFVWIVLIVAFFGIFRALAETGWGVWMFELIPAKARGKVEAISAMVGTMGAIIASLAAVLIMKNCQGLLGYQLAMYVGIFFGFIGLAVIWHLPGGQSQITDKQNRSLINDLSLAVHDPGFLVWLKGIVFIVISAAVFGFLPLYLSERIGFKADRIMLFSGCFFAGVLVSAYFWGWSADRFGSKPVFMSALAGMCLVPVFLFLLPRMDKHSVLTTGMVYAFFGIVLQGWGAGSNRYFYVAVLPSASNPTFYTALNVSLQSVLAAACSFFYGWLLDALRAVKFEWQFIHFDNFTVLFILMLFCYLGAFYIFRNAPGDSDVRAGEFVSFFFHGNPWLAFSSIVRYHFAEDESGRLELTRLMGDARSHLTVEELLQAVNDPSFNVRYEAIVSMARLPPNAKLIAALALAIRSREPSLSEAAVWALGRMGDSRAIPVLREMLKCEYALLRSQCARALAKLNDQMSVPEIMAAFKSEKNDNVRAGYAAALGRLRKKEMLPDFLALLRRLTDDRLRGEVTLAIARIIGGEHHFVNLWRRSRSDFETACAEELIEIEKRIAHSSLDTAECRKIISGCGRSFEQRNLASGADAIHNMIGLLPPAGIDPLVYDILLECDEHIVRHGGGRGDYILLALNALHMAIVSLVHAERKKRI